MNKEYGEIFRAAKQIRDIIPADVVLLAAAKTRTREEVEAVIQAGITHIGYNYVQEALPIIQAIGERAKWHMIGHLQRKKARVAIHNFDMIETVDSWRLAQHLDYICSENNQSMPVLIEINSGRESNKNGVLPDDADELITKMSSLKHVQVEGIMTMGPRFGDPEDSRPYFKATRRVFERIDSKKIPNIIMRYLSMGMSNSYTIAIEEGANIIRIGNRLFGER